MPFLVIASLIATAPAIASVPDGHPGTSRGGREWFEQRCLPLPNGWRRQGCEFGELVTVNLLELRQDRLFWNGDLINEQTLRDYIGQSLRLMPSPGIALVVDAASSATRAATIRHLINARFGCKLENVCVEYTASEWKGAQPPARLKVR